MRYRSLSKNPKGVFQGKFNGDNHTIIGMNVTNLSADGYIYGGLFGLVNLSTITSVKLMNVVVNVRTNGGEAYAGGLAGYATGNITNSITLNNWVNTSGTTNIGRFVGVNHSATITRAYAWRYMGLNISSEIIKPIIEDATGKNARTSAR